MKVSLLQTDIKWADAEYNIRNAASLVASSGSADVYVLPEMWSTGFATEPHKIAHDSEHNAALLWMEQTARDRQCAISGSLAIRLPDGTFRNRHYFVDGCSGKTVFYDKHHLFSYGQEDKYYVPGNEHVIVEYRGVRFLLLTCYDLRFPGWCRYTTGREFDAIIIVANWPDSRQSAWQVLPRARAIENQCYVIAANRVGQDLMCNYIGETAVIDPIGNVVAAANASGQEEVLTAHLDIDELVRRRNKFNVLADGDNFYYGCKP